MSGIVPWRTDPIRPEPPTPLHITVNGTRIEGLQGQSIAGILLAHGRTEWRTTVAGRRRGVFCGIGVCFDCIATVNGESDVRLCMRRAKEGDVIETQNDEPAGDRCREEAVAAEPDASAAGCRCGEAVGTGVDGPAAGRCRGEMGAARVDAPRTESP